MGGKSGKSGNVPPRAASQAASPFSTFQIQKWKIKKSGKFPGPGGAQKWKMSLGKWKCLDFAARRKTEGLDDPARNTSPRDGTASPGPSRVGSSAVRHVPSGARQFPRASSSPGQRPGPVMRHCVSFRIVKEGQSGPAPPCCVTWPLMRRHLTS